MVERIALTGVILLLLALTWLALRQVQMSRANRALATSSSGGNWPSLLYFKSASCAPCTVQDRYLRQLEKEQGISIRHIDTDRDPKAAARYGVFTIPTTLVIRSDGKIGFANYGLTNASELILQLEKLGNEVGRKVSL